MQPSPPATPRIRHLRRPALVLAHALLLPLLACGGDEGKPGGGQKVLIEDIPAQMADALCTQAERCFGPGVPLSDFGECRPALTAQLTDSMWPALTAAVEAGTVLFVPGQLGSCLRALEGQDCALRGRRPAACLRLFEGTVPPLEPCVIDEACEGAATCSQNGMCGGTCTAPTPDGETCSQDNDTCDTGLLCNRLSRCDAPVIAEDSEPCGGQSGRSCRGDMLCLGSDPASGASGRCRRPATLYVAREGEACDPDDDRWCRPGLSCVQHLDSSAGGPVQICARPVESGASCEAGIPSQCPEGEYCPTNPDAFIFEASCTRLPGAGNRCADTLAGELCATHSSCGFGDVCVAKARLGESCSDASGCYSGLCEADSCVGPRATCAVGAPAGP